jgi:hypothetical protein
MNAMTKILAAAGLALAAIAPAGAMIGYDPETSWVLLGLNWENGGGVSVLNVGEEAGIPNAGQAPLFRTKDACQAEVRRLIKKFAQVSHADGGGGLYRCSQLRDWTS